MDSRICRDLFRIVKCQNCFKNEALFMDMKTGKIYCDYCKKKFKKNHCKPLQMLNQISKIFNFYNQKKESVKRAPVDKHNLVSLNKIITHSYKKDRQDISNGSQAKNDKFLCSKCLSSIPKPDKRSLSEEPRFLSQKTPDRPRLSINLSRTQSDEIKKSYDDSIIDLFPEISSIHYTQDQNAITNVKNQIILQKNTQKFCPFIDDMKVKVTSKDFDVKKEFIRTDSDERLSRNETEKSYLIQNTDVRPNKIRPESVNDNKEILSKETDQTQKTCPLNEKYNKIAVSMSYTPVLSEKCPNSQNTDTHSQPKTSSFENQMPSLQENFSIEIPPNLPLQPSKSPKQKLRINIQTIKRRRTYKKRLRFCFSGLENKELSKCEIICSKLTKKFKDFDIVESIEEATHLFVKLNEEKLCTRRYKYLYAGLAGIPIIDCEFLRKLKKDYNIHQFYNFIPHGDKIFGRSTLPQNCFKENRKIFEKAIFFMEGIKITKECEQLIAIAGGLKRKGTKQPDDIELTNQKEIFDYISANEFL